MIFDNQVAFPISEDCSKDCFRIFKIPPYNAKLNEAVLYTDSFPDWLKQKEGTLKSTYFLPGWTKSGIRIISANVRLCNIVRHLFEDNSLVLLAQFGQNIQWDNCTDIYSHEFLYVPADKEIKVESMVPGANMCFANGPLKSGEWSMYLLLPFYELHKTNSVDSMIV